MNTQNYCGGENFNLRDVLVNGTKLPLNDRLKMFSSFINQLNSNNESLYMRQIDSSADREVTTIDPITGKKKPMLMFGSNNYLGLANHPYVKSKVKEAIDEFGVGIGGPPLLNGHTSLHAELEKRIAKLKKTDDALIFSSGYNANIGLLTALLTKNDIVIYDQYSHASFVDGLSMSKAKTYSFRHNDVDHLREILTINKNYEGDIYVGVEGVYSMDGDLSRLDEIVPLCKMYNAKIIVDDAHGTGVMGINGGGTSEHFDVEECVDIQMGTFSKTFGVVGGFVAGSKELINYLRFFARSHMFSASLPPTVIATVLAGMDVIENDVELRQQLWSNVDYAITKLLEIGLDVKTESGIIAIHVPKEMNIRKAALFFHQSGIFVNSIEYPAVPVNQQRFRISIMATHTKEDIMQLVNCVRDVWNNFYYDMMLIQNPILN
jgi:glycine C-acetyltransferase